MANFAATFRDLVMPDLRRSCRTQALAVARDRCGFTEASAAVLDQARRRGAAHLPDSLINDLIDWIDTTVLRTIVDIENEPNAARGIVDEALGAEWRTTP